MSDLEPETPVTVEAVDCDESVELKPAKKKQINWKFTEERKQNLQKAREIRKKQTLDKKIKQLEELKEERATIEPPPTRKKQSPMKKKKVIVVEESETSESESSVEVIVKKKVKAPKQETPPVRQYTPPRSRYVFL